MTDYRTTLNLFTQAIVFTQFLHLTCLAVAAEVGAAFLEAGDRGDAGCADDFCEFVQGVRRPDGGAVEFFHEARVVPPVPACLKPDHEAVGAGKVADEECAAGFADALHFPEHVDGLLHVMQDGVAEDEVEGVVVEAEASGFAALEVDAGGEALVGGGLRGGQQHGVGEVDAGDMQAGEALGEQAGDLAGAGPDVEGAAGGDTEGCEAVEEAQVVL